MTRRSGAGGGPASEGLPGLLGMLMLDDLTRRAVTALRESGVPVMVFKGRVNQDWLYAGSLEQRGYSDVDLLVAPDSRRAARRALRDLGLRDHHATVLGLYRPPHEEAWVGASGTVDLHWGLVGVPPRRWADAWDVLESSVEHVELSGRPVPCPGLVSRTLLVALQAAHSAPGDNARADLRRAVVHVPSVVWEEAFRTAVALECDEAFVSGLSVTAAGCAVVRGLGRRPRVTLATALADRRAPYRVALWSVRGLAGETSGRVPLRRTFAVSRDGRSPAAVARLRLAGAVDLVTGVVGYRRERRRWWRSRGYAAVPLEHEGASRTSP